MTCSRSDYFKKNKKTKKNKTKKLKGPEHLKYREGMGAPARALFNFAQFPESNTTQLWFFHGFIYLFLCLAEVS